MLVTESKEYKKLLKIHETLAHYESILSLLYWDERVFMNPKAASYRGKQIAILTEYIHKVKTSKSYAKLIENLGDYPDNTPQAINVKWWKYDYERNSKIPPKLISKLAKIISPSIQAWEEAKKKKNFKILKPYLKKMIDISKEMINRWGYEKEPYEALLKGYETDITPSQIENIFSNLKIGIKKLIDKYSDKLKPSEILKNLKVEKDKLEVFCKFLIKQISNLEIRLDPTSHPFATNISPFDVRITTNYSHWQKAIFGTLHELGHGIYDYYLPSDKYFGQPISNAVSLSIHESQSRFFENIIGRGALFWEYFYKELVKYIEDFKQISFEVFLKHINSIDLQPIRTEADEVTYNLHIIMRFEIERKIFNENFKVEDLPELWNEKFKEYFGYYPKDDSVGILQDIHWAESYFGYFPTYSLGNIISAQLYNTLKNKINVNEIKEGNFNNLINFLKENIYSLGKTYNTNELVKKVTGEDINSKYFMEYLEDKVKSLVNL